MAEVEDTAGAAGSEPHPTGEVPPAEAEPTSSPIPALLGVICAIVGAAALKAAATVLVPLVLAIFLCYLLAPIMRWLERRGVPHVLTLPVTLLLILGCLVVLQLFIVDTINDLSDRADFYAKRIETLFLGLLNALGVDSQALKEVDWVEKVLGAVSSTTVSFFGSIINFLFNLILVVTYTAFILLGRPAIERNIDEAFPGDRGKQIAKVIKEINQAIQRYIVAKIMTSFAVGVMFYIVLLAFGVDFALFWALLGFLLSFIPTIGSAVAAILPILLALVQFDTPITALWVALCLIATQQIIGNVIEPQVQGQSLNISPIVILFSLVFFGWMWGFWGMIISAPVASLLKIIFEHTTSLKPIAILLEKD